MTALNKQYLWPILGVPVIPAPPWPCDCDNLFALTTSCTILHLWLSFSTFSASFHRKVVGKLAGKVTSQKSPISVHPPPAALSPSALATHAPSTHTSLTPSCIFSNLHLTPSDPHHSCTPLHTPRPAPHAPLKTLSHTLCSLPHLAAATYLPASLELATSFWFPHCVWLWKASRKLPHLTNVAFS